MKAVVNLKLDPKMKQGVRKLAEKQLVNMTTVIRQAIDLHLKNHGVDWRNMEEEEE